MQSLSAFFGGIFAAAVLAGCASSPGQDASGDVAAAAGDAQSGHGVKKHMFGVSYADLKRIAKSIGKNQKLASELWATGNHDARVLATMVADPATVDADVLGAWVTDLDNYVITDALSAFAAKTPHAVALSEAWIRLKGEWTGQAGWNLVAHIAMNDEVMPDAWLAEKLATIQKTLAKSRNRVKHAMNGAIIAIGMRNPDLEKAARNREKGRGPQFFYAQDSRFFLSEQKTILFLYHKILVSNAIKEQQRFSLAHRQKHR